VGGESEGAGESCEEARGHEGEEVGEVRKGCHLGRVVRRPGFHCWALITLGLGVAALVFGRCGRFTISLERSIHSISAHCLHQSMWC